MELWDVYDVDRHKTGKITKRGDPLKKDEFRLVVHVCIFNHQGEMLIQQRQPFKKGWSNMWDISIGGHAQSGDSSQLAAMREVSEELGLSIDLSNIRPHLSINFDGGFDDIYLITTDIDINTLTLQYEEVQQAKWASYEEIKSMINEGIFIPYHKSLIQLLFDMRQQYGAHQPKI